MPFKPLDNKKSSFKPLNEEEQKSYLQNSNFNPEDTSVFEKEPMSVAEHALRPVRAAIEGHTAGLAAPAMDYPVGLKNWLGGGMKGNFMDKVREENNRQKEYEHDNPGAAGTAKVAGALVPSPINILGKAGTGLNKLLGAVGPKVAGLAKYGLDVGKGAVAGGALGTLNQAGTELGNAASDNASQTPAQNIGNAAQTGAAAGGLISGLASPVSRLMEGGGGKLAGLTDRQGYVYKQNPDKIEDYADKIFGSRTQPSNRAGLRDEIKDTYTKAMQGPKALVKAGQAERTDLLRNSKNPVELPAHTVSDSGYSSIDKLARLIKGPQPGSPEYYNQMMTGQAGAAENATYQAEAEMAHDLMAAHNNENVYNEFDPAGNKAAKDANLAGRAMDIRNPLKQSLGDEGAEAYETIQGGLEKTHNTIKRGNKLFLKQPFKAASTQGVDAASVREDIDALNQKAQNLKLTENGSAPSLGALGENLSTALTFGKDKLRHLDVLGTRIPLPMGQLGRGLIRGSNAVDALTPNMSKISPLFETDVEPNKTKKKSPED